MTFTNDLAIGRRAEKEFAKVLLDNTEEFRVVSLEFAQGKFKDWDIKIDCIPDWILTYEIKSDTMADKTWNFVIEFRGNKWNASWIYASKADYIVYYVKWEWWIQERGELILRLINTEKEEVMGGDGKLTSMWKIKCTELPNLFSKIKTNGQRGEETTEGTGEAG